VAKAAGLQIFQNQRRRIMMLSSAGELELMFERAEDRADELYFEWARPLADAIGTMQLPLMLYSALDEQVNKLARAETIAHVLGEPIPDADAARAEFFGWALGFDWGPEIEDLKRAHAVRLAAAKARRKRHGTKKRQRRASSSTKKADHFVSSRCRS
jgi:hypothetical protein